jgi:hypothetical protein
VLKAADDDDEEDGGDDEMEVDATGGDDSSSSEGEEGLDDEQREQLQVSVRSVWVQLRLQAAPSSKLERVLAAMTRAPYVPPPALE